MSNSYSIATWNVNSIKARAEHVKDWLARTKADVLMLQEIKCQNGHFPEQDFSDYHSLHIGQKSYNGVAIISKEALTLVASTFPGNPLPEEARFLHATAPSPLGIIDLINVYVPNGASVDSPKLPIKLEFLAKLRQYLDSLAKEKLIVVGGDFNIAPFDIDAHDPEAFKEQLHCSTKERFAMRSILNNGFLDLYRLMHQEKQSFSWWDYRASGFARNAGLRIDFLLGNHSMTNFLSAAEIDTHPRSLEGASDHTPCLATFEVPITNS